MSGEPGSRKPLEPVHTPKRGEGKIDPPKDPKDDNKGNGQGNGKGSGKSGKK